MSQAVKLIFQEKYQQIIEFLQKQSQERTDNEIIDMRNVLESFPFFVQFTNTKSQEFIEMCRHLQLECYPQSAILFNQGDAADKFYVVLKGQGFIYVKIPGVDDLKQVGTVGLGGAFGELALLFNSRRNATIKVDSATELMTLHKDDFKKYMKFHSSEHANQAFDLINSLDEFKSLEFPERVRLASKMDYKQFPSNCTIISQGQMFTNFYLIETGIIKFYRDVRFTTVQNGAIAFNAPYKDKDKDKDKYFTRPLKIEIDELGPGRFFAEYELFNYKQSQYTAITHMPCSVFLISQFDFNLMSTFQLSDVCNASKPYPTDEEIRAVFLEGVQWRVFRKQLVNNLSTNKMHLKERDPTALKKEHYNQDLKMFAVKSLTFEGLMKSYVNSGTSSYQEKNEDEQQGQMMLGQEIQIQQKSHQKSFFQNVETAIKQMKSTFELPSVKKESEQHEKTKPKDQPPKQGNSKKKILPKINPKVGSKIYNILIGR